MRLRRIEFYLPILFIALSLPRAHAACGVTNCTWDGSSSAQWATNANWSGSNRPNATTENAIIVSAQRNATSNETTSIACLEVQSGVLQSTNNITLSIVGDYFRATTANMITATSTHTNWVIAMAGTAAQSLDVVDPLNTVTISNNSTVTFNYPFTIRNALNLTGTTTSLLIKNDLTINTGATALTIPAGVTVEVSSGANFYSNVNIIVNGTLRIKDGATLYMANGTSITVNSGALLQMQGSSGNIATITANGSGSTFSMSVAGLMNASYFRIDRLGTTGVNLTGTLQAMANGEFHYLSNNGYAMTLGSASNMPATISGVGFYNDSGYATVRNFNATSYNKTAVTLNSWAGSAGGATKETDPNGKINWGAQAGIEMTLSNNTPSGSPPSTLAASSSATQFATFAFALNQSATATNITQVRVTMSGTANTSDLAYVRVYKDAGAGTACVYNAGVDTQVGSDLAFSGSPLTALVNFSAGDVQTSSDTSRGCFHIVAATSATAQTGNTIQFSLAATGDVTNSVGYPFSDSAGPPVTAGQTTITGGTTRVWQGDTNTNWNRTTNWTGSTIPISTTDCTVGAALNIALVNIASAVCQNVLLQSGGTLDFGSTTNELAAYGSLEAQSSYTFSNATSGKLAMRGASNQSLSLATAFPGSLTIANTGTSPNNVVSISDNSQINGSLTVTSGRLRIGTGLSLTVRGNVTVQTGAILDIEPGATLYLANGSLLTVNSGGTLELVGSSTTNANISGITATDAFKVDVNGTISANYYSLNRLGTPGLTIGSGATIDGTNHLQNGTFTYPVANSTTLLALKKQVPTNSMTNMSFALNGSSATGTKNVDTTGAAAGTLTISTYSGDIAGPTYDVDPTYNISWTGATNTLNVDMPSGGGGPSSVNAGGTYNMGRFRFKQSQAGASYVNTDITKLIVQMQGTASGSDVSTARIYYDSDCDGASGILLASGTFTGSPPSSTFNISAGSATVEADVSSPPYRCIYIEADISSSATAGATVGFQVAQASDVTNSQSYSISGSTIFPVTLGSAATIQASSSTTWTGTTNTTWSTATNWTAGVPSSTKDCIINDVTNDPVIPSGTATCKNLTIGNGTLTMTNGGGGVLQVYGNFQNTGTFTQNNGTLTIMDGGAGSNQSVSSATTLTSLTFNKTSGGQVSMGSTSLTINTLTVPGGSNFELYVGGGKTLILPNGATWPAGTFTLDNQSTLKIGASMTLSITGGTFRTLGVNDMWPQNLSNKATITRNGASGAWGFSASAGTISLTGFVIDWINDNGLVFSGTSNLTALNGGQFTNLSTNYNSMRALQLNTSNVPATATNIGWNWGSTNSPPSTSNTYKLIYSSGCGSKTISFDYWFGDWSLSETNPLPDTKVQTTSCTVVMGASGSPVTLQYFTGTAYDSSAVLEWKTAAEWNHRGFNLYRSVGLNPYEKINTDIIQHGNTTPEIGENYSWADDGIANGTTVLYVLESVNLTGGVKRYGPISLVPGASAGARPDLSTLNPIPGLGTGPTTNNPFVRDLGGGIRLTSISDTRVILDITTPTPVLTTSTWDPTYKKLSADGYQATLDAGYPALMHRSVLIEVDGWISGASLNSVSDSSSIILNAKIEAAPLWTLNNNSLTASYSPDAAAYTSTAPTPSENIQVQSTPVVVDGRKYLKVDFTPGRYTASLDSTEWLTKLRVAIVLTRDGTQAQPIVGNSNVTPSTIPQVLRVKVDQPGLTGIRYQDLVDNGVDSYFAGAPVANLRAYIGQKQFPIKVESSGATFALGDQILVYVPPFDQQHDCCQEVVIARDDLLGEGAALRVPASDAQVITPLDPLENWTFAGAQAESNLFMVWDQPVGLGHDHFFWKRAFNPVPPWVNGGSNLASFDIDLMSLRSRSSEVVTVRVQLVSSAVFAANVTSSFGLWVNSIPFRLAQTSSSISGLQEVVFTVPANYFSPGANTIQLEAIGDHMPTGEYQVTTIDKISVDFRADMIVENDEMEILSRIPGQTASIQGFSSSALVVWDVSEPTSPIEYQNYSVVANDGAYQLTYSVPNDGSNVGYRTWAIEHSHVHRAKEIFINRGYYNSIRSTSNRADLIIIANNSLMESAKRYAQSRQSSGLSVALFSTDQVFAEFSGGRSSAEAIRDMLRYTRQNWMSPKPASVLFIGKASVDPKNLLGQGRGPASVMPINLDQGIYEDYGSDHWFITRTDNDNLPDWAAGRLPATTNEQVMNYLSKVEAYEGGSGAPTLNNHVSHYIFTDADTSNEQFATRGESLKTELSLLRSDIQQRLSRRDQAASDVQFGSDIRQAINEGPLFVSLLGHGAIDFWADANVFSKTQVQSLNNSRYPIVLGMGCMLGYHYDPDPTHISLGESLIFQPNAGAILFWGTPAVTIPSAQVDLNQAFLKQFSQSQSGTNLGTLMSQAKLNVNMNDATKDTVRSWTLLGDPTVRLPASAAKPAQSDNRDNQSYGGPGCGTIGSAPPPPPSQKLIILLLFCMPMLWLIGLRRLAQRSR